VVAMPLVLLGLWLQQRPEADADEWKVRPYGILHPPVNPFLREDLKPRVYSRLGGQQ
jgi:hypothetical protein